MTENTELTGARAVLILLFSLICGGQAFTHFLEMSVMNQDGVTRF